MQSECESTLETLRTMTIPDPKGFEEGNLCISRIRLNIARALRPAGGISQWTSKRNPSGSLNPHWQKARMEFSRMSSNALQIDNIKKLDPSQIRSRALVIVIERLSIKLIKKLSFDKCNETNFLWHYLTMTISGNLEELKWQKAFCDYMCDGCMESEMD